MMIMRERRRDSGPDISVQGLRGHVTIMILSGSVQFDLDGSLQPDSDDSEVEYEWQPNSE